jgi:hypothetical protein
VLSFYIYLGKKEISYSKYFANIVSKIAIPQITFTKLVGFSTNLVGFSTKLVTYFWHFELFYGLLRCVYKHFLTMAEPKPKEKRYAEMMYLHENKTFKSIAIELNVREQTVGGWARDGQWQTTKRLMKTSDEELANKQTLFLSSWTKHIEEREENKNMPSSKEADAMAKIVAAREKLMKTVVTIPQLYLASKKMLAFIAQNDPELAKQVAPLFKQFTDTEIEKYNEYYGD